MKQFKKILALIICFACRPATAAMITELAMPSTERALTLHSLMKEPSSYLKYLVGDLQGLVDQYVNPWKATDLGQWLCNTEGRPFTCPDHAELGRALRYKEIQSKTLMEAYACCYQSIDELKADLQRIGLPHDKESIYQLLNSIREELIIEYLLQQKLFSLDYSPNESENSADEKRTKILLKNAGVSKNSIRSFALGLASALTEIELSSFDDPSNEISDILIKARSSCYSPYDSTIAGLLLIAGAVNNTNADDETSDKNIALRLAQRGDPIVLHEHDMLLPASYKINRACYLPLIRHSGNPRSLPNWHKSLYKEEDLAAPFFDRKRRFLLTYRLSREADNPQAQFHPEVIHFLVAAGARFNISAGWAKLDQFVFMNANINAVDRQGSALHKAIRSNQESIVVRLLTAHAYTEVVNDDGDTPLAIAIRLKFISIIDILLAADANPNTTNIYGDTPLHSAVESNQESIVDKLLAVHANIDLVNSRGETPLDIAARKNFLSIVDKLLAAGADTSVIKSGETPLHRAVERNQESVVDKLLATTQPPIDEKNPSGNTPLHIAVENNCATIINKLLAAGANTRATNESGETPLHRAVQRDQESVVDALLATTQPPIDEKNHFGDTPLHIAARINYVAILDKLLAAGANMNATNLSGDTPLHIAIQGHCATIIDKLLAAGANMNATNRSGDTPLHIAVENICATIIDKLLAVGANMNATNRSGDTPLDIAIRENFFTIIDKLLAAAANTPAPTDVIAADSALTVVQSSTPVVAAPAASVTNNSETRLHAVQVNQESVIDDLLTTRPPIDAINHDGYAPPHIAVQGDDVTIIEKSSTAGANTNAVNNNGDTPLHIVVRTGSFLEIDKLLTAGADVNAINNEGDTPSHLAVRLPAIICGEDFFISDPLKLYFNPVNKIVSADANLNIMNHNGDTPLHIAVRDGSFENVYLMLKHSPDLTLKNRDGKTAWDLARVTNDFSILYPLAGTLNQRVQALALHPLAKVAPIALLIGSALGIVIGKAIEKRLATNALKSINEKLSSHADEKARILHEGQALLTPLSQKSTLTMEEIEIEALKELLDTDLMKDLTKELTVLHNYRRALRDNQLHVEWTNLYKVHQDFFDVWDKVYTSFTRQSKLTSGETLDFMNKHFQLPLMIHTLKEEIFYRTPSDDTHQDALSNKQATILSQES